jgi:hypothetical protein
MTDHLHRSFTGMALAMALATSAAAQGRGVHVCVGADRVVRYEAADQCRPGEASHRLLDVRDEAVSAEQEEARERQITDLQKTVATLTERLSSLERAPDRKDGTNSTPASRVFAPFEVLDKMGNPILRVSDEQAAVGLKSASRVLLTRGTADNYVLQFRTAYGVYSSSIGESATGYGVVHLHDQGGNVRARGDAKDGFILFNGAAAPVGRLSFGPKGGGYLQLMEPGGMPMVEAGAFADGVGRVIAGPNFKCQGNPAALGLGLPDCIKGHQ